MAERQPNLVISGSERRIRPGYAWLLCMILCFLVVSGFEDRNLLLWAAGIFLKIAIFVLALHISDVGRKYFLAAVSLALIVAGASVPARMFHGGLEVIVLLTWSVLMLLVPFAILRKIGKEFEEEGVDLEVVLGALCAYLFIGAYFAFLYDVMARLSESPFFAQPGADSKLNYLYFSFVTLTTMGYGDITPVSPIARMLAILEAVTGVLYLSVLVARLVTLYTGRQA